MPAPVPDMVGRVVVRADADTPAVRLEARTRVGRLDLGRPGRTRHEILIVRSLRLEGAGLDDQLARARRVAVPLDGRPVPTGAIAVVAADLAQLLARFCVDLHDGALSQRWWWRVVSARFPQGGATAVLAAHPREAPHVVADLVRTGHTRVLGAGSVAAVNELLVLLAREHGAPRLAEVLRRTTTSARSPYRSEERVATGDRGEAAALGVEELLVLVATRLADDAQVARSAEFARFVAVAAGLPVDGTHTDDGPTSQRPPGRRTGLAAAPGPDASVVAPDHPTAQAGYDVSSLPSTSPDAGRSALRPRAVGEDDGQQGTVPATAQHPPAPRGEPVPADGVAALEPAGGDDLVPSGSVTALGGVFFLIHALDDLAPPGPVVDAVGPWGVLDLAARCLVAGRQDLVDDAIWAALGALGGRALDDRTQRLPAPVLARWRSTSVRRTARQLAELLEVAPDDLVDSLLLRPARITWDRTHVDVVLPLAAASVPVRRIGLDRDPGWVPSLGRVVAFHFDDQQFGGGLT